MNLWIVETQFGRFSVCSLPLSTISWQSFSIFFLKLSKYFKIQSTFQFNKHFKNLFSSFFSNKVKYDLTFDKQAGKLSFRCLIWRRRLNENLFAPSTGMKELNFASANNTNYLYTTEYNVVDFSVDDNGLWVIYSTPNSNHTIVSMLSATTLEAVYSLNISINHHKVCEQTSERKH